MPHPQREMTVEEFDAGVKATDKFEAVAEAADEEGGPRLSLVRLAEREKPWPTDLLPPAAEDTPGEAPQSNSPPPAAAAPPVAAEPFDGFPLEDSRKRLAGWSALRQRLFLSHLAETGSVHLACAAARISARSVYRLRARSPAFAAAFDVAQQLAVGRLSALAFDRAIHGRTEQVWHEGALVAEKRVPSDKLLMWLLARLDPRRFAAPWELRKDGAADPQAEARLAFPALLDGIEDEAEE
jgi:hypothetical protein